MNTSSYCQPMPVKEENKKINNWWQISLKLMICSSFYLHFSESESVKFSIFYKWHEFSFTRVFVFLSFYYSRPSGKKNKETINICALWAINTNSALVNLLMKLLDFYPSNTSMLTVTSVNIYVRVRHLSRIWRSHVMYCKKKPFSKKLQHQRNSVKLLSTYSK